MNNAEVLEELEKMKKNYPIASNQYLAVCIAIEAVKLQTLKPPMYVKAYCGTCGKEVMPGKKFCENCGQRMLWKGEWK